MEENRMTQEQDIETMRAFLEKHSVDPYVTSESEVAFNRIILRTLPIPPDGKEIKMSNAEKIKELLVLIHDLLQEEKKQIETVIDFSCQLIIKTHDEPEEMTWHEAMEKFGPEGTDKEWRMPTRIELDIMYENKDKISNLDLDGYYWSSREYNTSSAYNERFSDGGQFNYNKSNSYLVRCVRR